MPELTVREVAELADVTQRSVNKAVEERIIDRSARTGQGRRLLLPVHAVPYAAVMGKLDLNLTKEKKRRLLRAFGKRKVKEMTSSPIEIAPAVTVDVAGLVGADLGARTDAYVRGREEIIEENPDILGGTPVVRGTRVSVYSLLGRVEHGEAIETILEDYPDLTEEDIKTAVTYARTHPPRGRPGGRPWLKTA
jgi:uncharacterized protein (DUF433 family)